ncbi:MAG: toll/interleukin-1 receptor domain-containing protein [Clostridia bacterium]|nr:toll/interleukin-1 receptor domain-containing protein [Clostridia bacterium]
MDREYAAFISYRHLPLDMAVAARLHRRLEAYTIPRALRREGEKRLGLVFRDREELPLTSSLTDDIHLALDHSKYLIVICTPDLMKSRYCLDEVNYFLKHHDRDHVLAVLASGEPAESFPPALLTAVDPGTGATRNVEPLAANVVCPSIRGSLKRLDSEFLRLVAAMLGCPYDHLAQRQRRARRRRLAVATAAVVGVLAVYAGMLLIKNRQISDQLRQTQINESEALAYQSGQLLAQGYGDRAVETALRALPSEQVDRPVVASAVTALADALHVYEPGAFVPLVRVDQDANIIGMKLSSDEKYLVTLDSNGMLWAYAAADGRLLWHTSDDEWHTDFALTERGIITDWKLLDYDSGESLGTLPDASPYDCAALVGEDGDSLLVSDDTSLSMPAWYDAHTGERLAKSLAIPYDFLQVIRAVCSRDGRYLALVRGVSDDNAGIYAQESDAEVLIFERPEAGTAEQLEPVAEYRYALTAQRTAAFAIAALGDTDFAFFCGGDIYRLSPESKSGARIGGYAASPGYRTPIAVAAGERRILCVADESYTVLDAQTGTEVASDAMTSRGGILAAFWRDDEETNAAWITEEGVCGYLPLGRIGENPSFAAMSMAWRVCDARNRGTACLALCPKSAPQSVCLYRDNANAGARLISSVTSVQFDGRMENPGRVTVLDGGTALLRLDSFSEQTGASDYTLLWQAQDRADTVLTDDRRIVRNGFGTDNVVGLTAGGTGLILFDGVLDLVDQSYAPILDHTPRAVRRDGEYVWDTLFVARAKSGALPAMAAYVRTEDGRNTVDAWHDGEKAWSESIRFEGADLSGALLDYPARIGGNGWASFSLTTGEAPVRRGTALVDVYGRASSCIEFGDPLEYVLDAVGDGREDALYARLDYQIDGMIHIYRCDGGALLREYRCPVSPFMVEEMRFVMDDRLLLLRQNNNRLILLNVADGSTLMTLDVNDRSDPKDPQALVTAWNGDELYLVFRDDSGHLNAGGIVVDTADRTVRGRYPQAEDYLPATDELLCWSADHRSLYLIERYDCARLMQRAAERRSDIQ